MFGGNIILVTTRDVLSCALVCSNFFPAESTCVSFWSAQCELCERCPAQQVLVFPFHCCCVSSPCARDCALDSIHGTHNGSRKSHVSILSCMVAEPVFI